MRMLLITQDFPPDVGGTQTYSWELSRRFADDCKSFAVVAPTVPGAEEYDEQCPFEVIRVSSSYDSFAVRAAPVLSRLIKTRGTEVTFSVSWPSQLACGLAASIGGRRSRAATRALAAHGRELLFQPTSLAPAQYVYEKLRKRAIESADVYFPVSRYTAKLLARYDVGLHTVHTVNNGTDPFVFRPVDGDPLRRELGIPAGPVMLTVSRLVERKGVDTALRALPHVLERLPDVQYVIGGNGPRESHLRALAAKLDVQHCVHFVGYVPYTKLRDLYSLSDVFVLPARESKPDVEGFGIVFLEANACERPVIGCATGGIPDAIEHNRTGLLVPPDDPDSLSDAIVNLLTDRDARRRMGLAGRRRVEDELNWDRISERILHVLSKYSG